MLAKALKYSLISLLYFFSHCAAGLSQKTVLLQDHFDSLQNYIANGEARIAEHCSVAGHTHYVVPRLSLYFSEGALTTSVSQRELIARVDKMNNDAMELYSRKNYNAAGEIWKEALNIAIKNDLSFEELHELRPALNNNAFLAGDYLSAMQLSSNGLSRAEQIHDTDRIIHFSNVIGYIHMKQKNFDEARNYFQRQLQLAEVSKDSAEQAHAQYNLADLLLLLGKYDSAIHFLQKADQWYSRRGRPMELLPGERHVYIANKLSEAYKLKGDFRTALGFAMIATDAVQKNPERVNDYDEAEYLVNAGDIYNRLHQTDSAIYFLQKAERIARAIVHREFMRDAYEQLAIAYAAKNDFRQAFMYQGLFTRLKDSIASESNQQEILRREAALQIERQQQVQHLELQRQRTSKNIIIAVSVALLLSVLFFYNQYRLRQKNRYQVELNRQQVELFNTIAAAQDEERKRIAQDLHDGLGSVLSAAKLNFAEIQTGNTALAGDRRFNNAMSLLDEASGELRNISHNIMPATLSKLGLVPALKNLCEKISGHEGLQIGFSAHEFDERPAEQTELSLYRIVLELINNIVRHAHARKANVQLVKYPDHVNITVEDDGVGFDAQQVGQEKKGMGLSSIYTRVGFMNGRIDIDTEPGRGTIVIIDIPLAIT